MQSIKFLQILERRTPFEGYRNMMLLLNSIVDMPMSFDDPSDPNYVDTTEFRNISSDVPDQNYSRVGILYLNRLAFQIKQATEDQDLFSLLLMVSAFGLMVQLFPKQQIMEGYNAIDARTLRACREMLDSVIRDVISTKNDPNFYYIDGKKYSKNALTTEPSSVTGISEQILYEYRQKFFPKQLFNNSPIWQKITAATIFGASQAWNIWKIRSAWQDFNAWLFGPNNQTPPVQQQQLITAANEGKKILIEEMTQKSIAPPVAATASAAVVGSEGESWLSKFVSYFTEEVPPKPGMTSAERTYWGALMDKLRESVNGAFGYIGSTSAWTYVKPAVESFLTLNTGTIQYWPQWVIYGALNIGACWIIVNLVNGGPVWSILKGIMKFVLIASKAILKSLWWLLCQPLKYSVIGLQRLFGMWSDEKVGAKILNGGRTQLTFPIESEPYEVLAERMRNQGLTKHMLTPTQPQIPPQPYPLVKPMPKPLGYRELPHLVTPQQQSVAVAIDIEQKTIDTIKNNVAMPKTDMGNIVWTVKDWTDENVVSQEVVDILDEALDNFLTQNPELEGFENVTVNKFEIRKTDGLDLRWAVSLSNDMGKIVNVQITAHTNPAVENSTSYEYNIIN